MRRTLTLLPAAVIAFGVLGAGNALAQEGNGIGNVGQLELTVSVDCIEETADEIILTATNPGPGDVAYTVTASDGTLEAEHFVPEGTEAPYAIPAAPDVTYTFTNIEGVEGDPATITTPDLCETTTTPTTPTEPTTPTTTTTTPSGTTPPSEPFEYENCDAARAAGADPVYEDEYGYGPHLDSDSDGIGCEVNDDGTTDDGDDQTTTPVGRGIDVDSGVIPVGGTETGPGAEA